MDTNKVIIPTFTVRAHSYTSISTFRKNFSPRKEIEGGSRTIGVNCVKYYS